MLDSCGCKLLVDEIIVKFGLQNIYLNIFYDNKK